MVLQKPTIKHCVGVVLHDTHDSIFLMTSPKWYNIPNDKYPWLIPGGRIEPRETEEGACHREIKEELGIEITDLVKFDSSIYKPGSLFHKPNMLFYFETYHARALSTEIRPNSEIREYGWFSYDSLSGMYLLPSVKKVLQKFYDDD